MKIDAKLKLLRKSTGYTQKKIAGVMGITDRGYQKIENGNNGPSYKVIENLCKEFPQYSLWLMTGETLPPNQISPEEVVIKQETEALKKDLEKLKTKYKNAGKIKGLDLDGLLLNS